MTKRQKVIKTTFQTIRKKKRKEIYVGEEKVTNGNSKTETIVTRNQGKLHRLKKCD